MIRSNGFWTIFAAAAAVQIAAGQFIFFPGLVGQQHNKKEAFFSGTQSVHHISLLAMERWWWWWCRDFEEGQGVMLRDTLATAVPLCYF